MRDVGESLPRAVPGTHTGREGLSTHAPVCACVCVCGGRGGFTQWNKQLYAPHLKLY